MHYLDRFEPKAGQIIIKTDKYGSDYWDASSWKNMGLACFNILLERLGMDYYPDHMEEKRALNNLKERQAELKYKMTHGGINDIEIAELADVNDKVVEYQLYATDKTYGNIIRILNMIETDFTAATKHACYFLSDRSRHEYEGFEIRQFSKITEPDVLNIEHEDLIKKYWDIVCMSDLTFDHRL